ncbi:helix-turn-helix transcriptional regulator [Candidatus Phytoplasma meliae]|uniref:Response regulator transcription factor n=1 Tax=Candidatus Phytoplasma meliae TaxID=1848402 RepID=A0ABS5CYD1_9MOLU|nr:LuxR C-terminal-related transcriptional regulator [Candidatus Phytoplasma meliae]MBP5835981.1 response regulator transcription factor [Candidatus Phytoplasma meliae]
MKQSQHEKTIAIINKMLTPTEKQIAILSFGFNLNNEIGSREFSYEFMPSTLTDQQIAKKLNLSIQTIKNQKTIILRKLKNSHSIQHLTSKISQPPTKEN